MPDMHRGQDRPVSHRKSMTSRLMGIIDRYGGLRVVITDGNPYCHLNPGERLHIVPNYPVEEPVPVQDWPQLVKVVEDYIKGA